MPGDVGELPGGGRLPRERQAVSPIGPDPEDDALPIAIVLLLVAAFATCAIAALSRCVP